MISPLLKVRIFLAAICVLGIPLMYLDPKSTSTERLLSTVLALVIISDVAIDVVKARTT